MSEADAKGKGDQVRCGYCEEWLPADEAVSPEGDDYALFFCGTECHAAWLAERAAAVDGDFERHSGVRRHHGKLKDGKD